MLFLLLSCVWRLCVSFERIIESIILQSSFCRTEEKNKDDINYFNLNLKDWSARSQLSKSTCANRVNCFNVNLCQNWLDRINKYQMFDCYRVVLLSSSSSTTSLPQHSFCWLCVCECVCVFTLSRQCEIKAETTNTHPKLYRIVQHLFTSNSEFAEILWSQIDEENIHQQLKV